MILMFPNSPNTTALSIHHGSIRLIRSIGALIHPIDLPTRQHDRGRASVGYRTRRPATYAVPVIPLDQQGKGTLDPTTDDGLGQTPTTTSRRPHATTMRQRQRHQSSSSLPWLLMMLLCLLLLLPMVRAIEIKWTPADGEGPLPASKKYRDAMARQQQQQHQQGGGMSEEDQLRMMQQMMMQQQGQQQRPPSFLERLLLAGYMAVGGTVAIAQRHPKAAATLSLTAVTGLCLRRAARRNGLLLTRRPHYWTLLEPPVEFLAALLEEELPMQVEKQEEQAAAVTAFQGTVSIAGAEEDEDGKTARRRVKVGEGEAAYRKAATLVRTLSLLDALAAEAGEKKGGPSVGRLFCSERMREGLFLAPRPGRSGWSIGPVAIRRRAGRLSSQSKKNGKKGKKKDVVIEEAYEEVLLRALPGCAWGRGAELRLAASWRDPVQGTLMYIMYAILFQYPLHAITV